MVLRELFYITHVSNIKAILEKGILSHNKLEKASLNLKTVSIKSVEDKRSEVKTPDGRSLWDFARFYFQARNPMLFTAVRNYPLNEIAVIGIDKSIVERPDVFLSTGNAAHSNSRIVSGLEKQEILPFILDEVNRPFWNEADGSKRTIMAECLVPEGVAPSFIRSIYFGDYMTKYQVQQSIEKLPDTSFLYAPEMFFQPIRTKQITPNLTVVDGDIYYSSAQTLTLSVNTVGVMGKGMASRAKYQTPDVYVNYQDFCRSNQLSIGSPVLYKREVSLDNELSEASVDKNVKGDTWFLLFPTRSHWSENTNINTIETGLKWIVENYKQENIRSLAVPALGCGSGGLDWAQVGPLICQKLSLLDIPVSVFLPLEHQIPDQLISAEFLLGQKSP